MEQNNSNLERALFAAGCFWKVEYVFGKTEGVIKATSGYSGGKTDKPSYEQVCSGGTGHAETVLVEFDPRKVSYRQLLEVFFAMHDPTTPNRQGPDIGSQYRSAVFFTSKEQEQEVLKYVQELENSKKFRSPIVTKIEPAGEFFKAEEYHQDYYIKHGAVCS